MARLPIPGSDDGSWGDILNAYLLQSLTADGSIRTGVVGSPQLADTAVTSAKLAPSAVTASHLSTGSVTNSAIADGAIAQGKIANLSGDLAGKASTTHTHSIADTTSLQTTLDSKAASVHTHTASQISDASTAGRSLMTAADAATQRSALGLGSAATLTVGTTAGTVAAGDDSRLAGAQSAATLDADVAALVGDGGSSVASVLSSTFARRRGTRVVLFGDSHAQGTTQQGTGSDWRTNKNYPIGAGMLAWAVWLSGSRVQFWGNYGVGGERTDQIYARINEVLTSGGDLVILQMGTNDSRQGYSLTHTQTYYRATVEAILAAGMDLILVGVPPCVDGQDAQDKINAWLKWYAAEMRLPFVDTFAALANTTTRAIATTYNGDGVHINALGSKIVGQAIADVIGGLHAPIVGWGAGSNVDATNILSNALGLTDATSDGIPDGWSTLGTPSGGTATHTLEDVTGWAGKAFCIEQSTNASARQLYRDTNINTGKFAVGDLIRASVRAKMTGTLSEVTSWVNLTNSTTGRTTCRLLQAKTATDTLISTIEFRVPAGCTYLTFYLYAGTGTGKAYFGQPTLTNLTALGITDGIE